MGKFLLNQIKKNLNNVTRKIYFSSHHIKHELNKHVLTIHLSRSDKANCLTFNDFHCLSNLLKNAENNNDIHSTVITGNINFCSGIDMKELLPENANNIDSNLKKIATFLPTKKPIVCAINGFAVGEGFQLALMADVRISQPNAVFGFLERRFGVPFLIPQVQKTLLKYVNLSQALDLILTGRLIDAQTALNWNLLDQIVEADKLNETAILIAQNLAEKKKYLKKNCSNLKSTSFKSVWLDDKDFTEKKSTFLSQQLGSHGKNLISYPNQLCEKL